MSYICVLDDWEIVKDNLTILDKKLGGGCFGVVKKGMYKQKDNDNDADSQVVAVKMLKGAYLILVGMVIIKSGRTFFK